MKIQLLVAASALTTVMAASKGRQLRTKVKAPHDDPKESPKKSFMDLDAVEQRLADMARYLQAASMSMSMPTDSPVAPPTPVPVISTPAPVTPETPAPMTPVDPPTDAPTIRPVTNAPVAPPTESPTPAPVPDTPPTEAPVVSTPTPAPAATVVPTKSPTFMPTPLSENRKVMIERKCGVTPLERSRDILSILSLISDPVELVTPSSPQFQARNWIDNTDMAIICADARDRIGQRYRTALLYYAMEGSLWYNCRAEADAGFNSFCLVEDTRNSRRLQKMEEHEDFGVEAILSSKRKLAEQTEIVSIRWLGEANECEWFGLDCGDEYDPDADHPQDAYYSLVNIDLNSNNLQGKLYTELFGFSELQGLFLDGNLKISGNIPSEIGDLTQLKFLDIDDSMLTGTLPSSLYTLSDLIKIDLNSNRLTGTLSQSIGDITGLEVLQLENNFFTGPLPDEGLFELLRLVALTVQGNLFTGTLEPLCEVVEERRQDYEPYLEFIISECGGDDPLVDCSCCECPT